MKKLHEVVLVDSLSPNDDFYLVMLPIECYRFSTALLPKVVSMKSIQGFAQVGEVVQLLVLWSLSTDIFP